MEAVEIDRKVGESIRTHREAQGLSVAKVAQALQVTPDQIERYEAGQSRVSASKLFDISGLLKTPISSFFIGITGPPEPITELVQLAGLLPPERQRELVSLAKAMLSGHEVQRNS